MLVTGVRVVRGSGPVGHSLDAKLEVVVRRVCHWRNARQAQVLNVTHRQTCQPSGCALGGVPCNVGWLMGGSSPWAKLGGASGTVGGPSVSRSSGASLAWGAGPVPRSVGLGRRAHRSQARGGSIYGMCCTMPALPQDLGLSRGGGGCGESACGLSGAVGGGGRPYVDGAPAFRAGWASLGASRISLCEGWTQELLGLL